MEHPGLDDAFLRYIRATPENQRRIQSFYLPFFHQCRGRVLDLACGHGDFVQLLTENGVDALGVDSDPACCQQARERGVDIVCEDVFDYLQEIAEDTVSGIFCAHLVEHLPYQQVMQLVQLAYRVLEPGGIILLATPNVRGLYPHLESFYMHFGHVTFYHPKLLSFFLDYSGFSNPRMGENPRMADPLWRDVALKNPDKKLTWSISETRSVRVAYPDWHIPSKYSGVLGRAISTVKTWAARLLVRPLLEETLQGFNKALQETVDELQNSIDETFDRAGNYVGQVDANARITHQCLMELDRSTECYVYATKGDGDIDLPSELTEVAP